MKLVVLPGDDIGPEIVAATLEVLAATDNVFALGLQYDIQEVGMAAHRQFGTTLPGAALSAIAAADGVLLGPAGMTAYPPVKEGGINIPGTIRKQFDLFANIRPARSRAGIPKACPGLDCVIVRENTEGFYADRNLYQGYGEFMPTPEVAIALRVVTAKGSRRIAERAFHLARGRRKHVTVVGKRHVLQVSEGVFYREVEAVAKEFPDIGFCEADVDAVAANLCVRPQSFDVILTTNMFGDILSNLAYGLSGSLGLAASLNVGEKYAAANAGHGSAPDIAGKGVANPVGIVLSAALLLRWFGEVRGEVRYLGAADKIEQAVDITLASKANRTRDLDGTASTKEVTAVLCAAVRN
jgi:3-isopropylmalate dehydrogenase